MGLQHGFIHEGAQRLVGEGVAEAFGRPVGSVGIPEMDVEIPVPRGAVPVEPVQRHRQHLLPRFSAAATHVIGLMEAGGKPPGGMPLREGADGGGEQARLPEQISQIRHNKE